MEEDGGNGALCIGKVIQKTFISVDEKGTKAGAATVVEMRKNTAIMPAGYMIDLDRPFVYMIIDTEYDLPLFIGVECSTTTEKY
jgi:serpin B